MNRPVRRLAVIAALLAPAAVLPAVADGAVTTATITAPADGYSPVFNWLDGAGPNRVQVSGTVNAGAVAGDKLDIVCQRRGEALAAATGSPGLAFEDALVVASGTSRTFVANIDASVAALRTPCRLRAIPAGTETSFNQANFPAGPMFFPSGLRDLRETNLANDNLGVLYDVDASTVTPGRTSTAHIESFGGCGLWDARPLDPAVGPEVAALNVFDCAGYADDVADGTTPTRSELQVDGRNAFTGAMAALATGGLPGVSGRPPLTRTATRDPLTGLLHVTESTDVVRCQTAPAAYPFTNASECGTFVSTGLRMTRDATMSRDGRVTTMRDTWSSTDGADHILDLLFEIDFSTQKYGIQVPWTAPDLAAYPGSASLAGPPSVPASILVRSDRDVPAGDLAHPTGAITFATAPTSVEFVSGLGDPSRFLELRYLRNISAGQPLELTHTFSMAPTAAESAALAAQAEDAYGTPSVSLSGPTTSSTPQVTVTGTASDNGGLPSLTVAGGATPVAADGSWRRVVTLAPGANTVTARAVDAAGNAAEASVLLSYVPPAATAPAKPVVPCVVPKLAGLKTPAATIAPLRKAGCALGRTLSIYSKPKTVRKGKKLVRVVTKRFTVLATKQKRGAKLAPGAKVDVIVQGPKPKPKKKPSTKKPSTKTKTKTPAKKPLATTRKPKPPVYTPDLPAR